MSKKGNQKSNLEYKTFALDTTIYEKFKALAKENRKENKGLKTASGLIRDAMEQYLAPSDYDYLIQYEKRNLINYFSIDESKFVLDVISRISYSIGTINPKSVLITNIENSILISQKDKEYNINSTVLTDKINLLSETQCYIIISSITSYIEKINFSIQSSSVSELLNVEEIKKIFYLT